MGTLKITASRCQGEDVEERGTQLGCELSDTGARDATVGAQKQHGLLVGVEPGFELAAAVEVEHGLGPPPPVGRDPGAGQRRPHVLLAVVEVLDRDPPQLALEHLRAPLGLGRDREHAPLDAQDMLRVHLDLIFGERRTT